MISTIAIKYKCCFLTSLIFLHTEKKLLVLIFNTDYLLNMPCGYNVRQWSRRQVFNLLSRIPKTQKMVYDFALHNTQVWIKGKCHIWMSNSSIWHIGRTQSIWFYPGAIAMKAYSIFPKAPALLEPHHQTVLVIYSTLIRTTVSYFNNSKAFVNRCK